MTYKYQETTGLQTLTQNLSNIRQPDLNISRSIHTRGRTQHWWAICTFCGCVFFQMYMKWKPC